MLGCGVVASRQGCTGGTPDDGGVSVAELDLISALT